MQESSSKIASITTIATITNAFIALLPSNAIGTTLSIDTSSNLAVENGLLESRVLENLLSPPSYGMEGADVFYPSYFKGLWDVSSKTTSVQAPCGIVLFGGNLTYTKATKEVEQGLPLLYKARFVPMTTSDRSSTSLNIIADREFNIPEIANAAMGSKTVMDIPYATPNKVSIILAPYGSNQIYSADLLTLSRRSEYINPLEFHTSEVVRQIIAPVTNGSRYSISNPTIVSSINSSPSSKLLKEIETISLYKVLDTDTNGNANRIECVQRSATFLLPSQQDPIAYKMWEVTRGRPIDVRFYNVTYNRAK